ncbi:MAG: hypothetical protein COA78_32540 [Blastopirellula sp.]|nr:MAG: hypothetical protein COA78_32540 [Blastopirellula sp.]
MVIVFLRFDICYALGEYVNELERNLPGHQNWEGSFFERLTEYGDWEANAFWRLHLELLQLARSTNVNESVDRELSYMLLYIQQKVLNLISAHFDKDDVFNISNLTNEQLHEYQERFDMAILGVVTGKVLPESSFDLVNPLANNA